ncbi:MAG: sulfurtransferase TusA family protein [Actinomycetes bacterium]
MKEIDCLGLKCPLPIILMAKELQTLAVGESLLLKSDDPATTPDLSAWSRMTGNGMEKIRKSTFVITKKS